MIFADKKVGETPLEFLNRLRLEHPDLAEEKLSYAGRLDPMAEGQMLVIVGEENKRREEFMGFDKEYVATFLIGMTTDTGDALGMIESHTEVRPPQKQIADVVNSFKKIETQKYPWFSGKTVRGIKLFDIFKSGNKDIERPSRSVEIKRAELGIVMEVPALEIKRYITESIRSVHGDFRQNEILEGWEAYFKENQGSMQIFTARFMVSSGTFIRALTEVMPFPALLLKLNRTRICTH